MPTVTMQLRANASLADAAGAAIEGVRGSPADAALRTQLFQLFCLRGEWQRALAQLAAAARLDPAREEMARVYRELIRCEALRAEVFAGRRAPLLLGQPAPWLAHLVEALRLDALGHEAGALRAGALEAAAASAGSIDGVPFAWLADADSRLGPVQEAIVNGKYYWIPFEHLLELEIEAPSDLRDLVWIPARLAFANGGRQVAFIPTRYPGLDGASDALLMARRTEWRALGADAHAGFGQRMYVTDGGDYPLLEVRRICFGQPGAEAGDA